MLKIGEAEPATTEWTSPIVFVPKKNGRLRFCIDYRHLNAVTVCDSYLILRMDDCIDSLERARILSIFDANSGF